MNSLFRHPSRLLPIVTAFGMFSLTPQVANAEPIISVDFGAGGLLLEEDFVPAFSTLADGVKLAAETLSVQNPLVPSGSLELTLGTKVDFSDGGHLNLRNRPAPVDSGAFTYGEFFQDRIVSINGDSLFLRLDGLQPNTEFQIQVWGYDNAKPGNFELLDRTGGNNVSLGGYSVVSGVLPTSNNDFSVLATVTSDADGTIILESDSNIDGTGIMNGFVLSAVPEPTTAVAPLGGIGVLMSASRFRRSR